MKLLLLHLSLLCTALCGRLSAVPPAILDLALEPAFINTNPGPEYSDEQRDYAMVIGMDRTPKGRIWAVWVAGGDSDKGYFVAASSGDNGAMWSKPRLVIDPPDVPNGLRRRVLVGNFWTDPTGRLWLFYDQSMGYFDGRAGAWAITCDNPDADRPVWSAPRRIWHGATLNKPVVLKNGDWLMPISLWTRDRIGPKELRDGFHELDDQRMAHLFVSTDKGATWTHRGGVVIPQSDFDEHIFVELKDGRLWMLARTKYGIAETFSSDGGRTWTEPKPSAIQNPSARFFLRRLASGRLLLVKNGPLEQRTGRTQMTAFFSEDEGKSWKGDFVFEERNGVSYPDGFQSPNGSIHILYDRERAKEREILMARFTEADVLAGRLVSPGSQTKMLVSKARGPLKTGSSRGEEALIKSEREVSFLTSAATNEQRRGQAAHPRYPPSPVIAALEWAPTNQIIRKAKDGDNWPVTWADDDAIYTTWGDGTGFVPKVEKKLSMGFARVTGTPDNFTGVNVRSDAEQLGQGRAGKKGWGVLCVEGVLHLWLGHADNHGATAQLAWSRDHAKTWTFADWKFAEFGLMGFVNFGRNYAGARDEFVYAYSHDGPHADTPADRFILMRVPKNRLTQRESWEFLVKAEANGQPVWTKNIQQRGAVFQHPDACLRSAMTYNAGLRRYLWWQHIPQPPGVTNDRGDTRFTGGFAVYDAPEPWGPWTTAFFTEKWDVGPGEHGDFPAKWMSADGQTLQLVFSGEDSFSVRAAKVKLRTARPAQSSSADARTAVESAHREIWKRFVDEYNIVLDYTDLDGRIIRPTPQDCREHKPSALSWGVPVEDGPMFNGLYLDAMCNRWKLTRNGADRAKARRLVDGLIFLASLGNTPGFIARGVATDGKTTYPMGSNDQTTPWLYGIWRYVREGLAEPAERARLVEKFCEQVKVLDANGWRMPCDGGPSQYRGDFTKPTWEGAPRLLFVMKAMHEFTGDARWQERYLAAANEKVGKAQRSRLEICRTGMVFDPGQGLRHSWTGSEGVVCLRALWEMEADPALRAAYAQGLRASAELSARSLSLYANFNVNGTEHFEHNWRLMNEAWKPQHSEADTVAVANAGLRVQHRVSPRLHLEKDWVREPCFAAWVVTLCPDAAFVAQHREAIEKVITHYRYDRLYLSQFFPVESAWYRLPDRKP